MPPKKPGSYISFDKVFNPPKFKIAPPSADPTQHPEWPHCGQCQAPVVTIDTKPVDVTQANSVYKSHVPGPTSYLCVNDHLVPVTAHQIEIVKQGFSSLSYKYKELFKHSPHSYHHAGAAPPPMPEIPLPKFSAVWESKPQPEECLFDGDPEFEKRMMPDSIDTKDIKIGVDPALPENVVVGTDPYSMEFDTVDFKIKQDFAVGMATSNNTANYAISGLTNSTGSNTIELTKEQIVNETKEAIESEVTAQIENAIIGKKGPDPQSSFDKDLPF